MAKQTFTTGQVLTAAQQNSLQANDFNQTVSVKTANYSLLAADKGTRIEFNTSGSVTCTVNSGQFDAGDTLIIQNRGAGTATITAGTATVNTSASLALSQYSAGTLYFVSDSAALFFGDAAGISASIVDAKGDLIVGTADNTVARLAVGTNGHTLVADSSVSPTGLKWAVDPVADVITTAGDLIYGTAADTVARLGIGTAGQVLKVNSGATAPEWGAASAASYSGVSLGNTADQTISNTTNTAITWSTEGFDTDSFHSTVTNTSRITIPAGKAGKYQVNLFGSWYNNSTGVRILSIYLNGAVVKVVKMQSVLEEQSQMIAMTLNLSVGDYVEGYVYQNSGGSRIFYTSGDQGHMSMSYLGA